MHHLGRVASYISSWQELINNYCHSDLGIRFRLYSQPSYFDGTVAGELKLAIAFWIRHKQLLEGWN